LTLPVYAKTWVRGSLLPTNQAQYALLDVVNKKGQQRLAVNDEIAPIQRADGVTAYGVTNAAVAEGLVKPVWDAGMFKDLDLHAYLGQWIYRERTAWDYIETPAYASLGFFAVLLCFALPTDRKRRRVLREGRRLSGPELVTTAEFNRKLGKRRWLKRSLPDGLALINTNRSWAERVFHDKVSHWVRIPREREVKHFMVMGDTGTGKSVTIMQFLIQARERGEAAVIYDPKGTYFEQFGDLSNGDILLNPLDERSPFYALSDEIVHPAEALAVATSLFPDQKGDIPFFRDATRKIFAYLLNLKPTTEQLISWLCNEKEIDRLLKGMEHTSKVDPHGGPQRAGVFGSLSMVGDALRLLPHENETTQRWSAAQWAKERKGFIFITSQAMTEESLRPLISLWIDLLALRSINEGPTSKRKIWFVLDELANLQRLPQLAKAITQSRESNCAMVLGFQGKGQLDELYGENIAGVMLSSPTTRIYLKTSEPGASKWISEAIGEVEIERYRESRTRGQFPQTRNSESEQRDTTREPLVMPSLITGLDDLHGYLKHGNLVVRLRVPHLKLPARNVKFIERKMDPVAPLPQEQEELPLPSQGPTPFFE
jgi:hypothetical protein